MAGGNYGGNSIPTTPIGGAALIVGKDTTYKDYTCTSINGTAATGTFTYNGVVMAIDAGHSIDLVVYPPGVTVATDVVFMCYDCSCESPMTGTTSPSAFYTGFSGETMFRPTIIGGGGLNS